MNRDNELGRKLKEKGHRAKNFHPESTSSESECDSEIADQLKKYDSESSGDK